MLFFSFPSWLSRVQIPSPAPITGGFQISHPSQVQPFQRNQAPSDQSVPAWSFHPLLLLFCTPFHDQTGVYKASHFSRHRTGQRALLSCLPAVYPLPLTPSDNLFRPIFHDGSAQLRRPFELPGEMNHEISSLPSLCVSS